MGAQPRIVVIGLGVVGAALADELVLRGMARVTVIDQGPLYVTGGSSSHAPGFVFQTTPSRTMSLLAQRTLAKLDGRTLPDGSWVARRTGGLEIATTPERLRELRRRHGLASSWGIPSRLVDAEEAARLWPGLDPGPVLGGFFTPTDAVVKGVRAVEWQARRAADGGARIVGSTRAVGLRTAHGRVTGVEVVPVRSGPPDDRRSEIIDADVVIACAGLWGPGLTRELLGVELPMQPMEHGFGFSEPLPALSGIGEAEEVRRPMLRHQDHAMYLREWGDRIAIGAYEHRPIPVQPEGIAGPDEFAATGIHPAVHPFTPEDFAPTWREAQRLLPELREARLDASRAFNGIFSFTPDGGPLLGPVPGTAGLWSAQAVWVTQSAGVAQVMADWIVRDEPGIDTHGLDLNRFDPAVVSAGLTRQRGEEAYDEVYDIVHPRASTARMRGMRTPPFHDRQAALGAVFAEAGGWERPLWYEANAGLLQDAELLRAGPYPVRDAWAGRHWSPIAAAEARAARARAGLFDISSLMRVQVAGDGATEALSRLLSRPVGRPGRIVYALLLDRNGGVLSDVTVTRLGEEELQLGVNGPLDTAWLRERLPGHLSVRVVSSGACGLGLWGPKAAAILDVLAAEDRQDTGFGFYQARQMRLAGLPVLAQRLSYVGEHGWELYTPAEFGRALWDALWQAGREHGLVAAGRRAFESMRLEKGYRMWGADLTREDTPAEAGLGFAVREGHSPAADAALTAPVRRRLVCLLLDDPAAVVLGHEPVYADGGELASAGSEPAEPSGYVTSADQGYTTGTSIAYAWLPPQLSAPGTAVQIEYLGSRLPAHVAGEPVFDPEGARMRPQAARIPA
ncbi:FAD-dependent oxidoreductase [Sediminivirga luteola]|uniref:Sarcosine dehydrogenase n=1 Tax=Sediminivirga luteola TaxID=1774748 RepID=A0A8J2TVA4_9MICO|nr:FAD-dependent oxidoreductase [Sediminivirga luteola]MCI2264614.1 FAD-dependent oxidoreductase [Sediminivirga luteola]GGA03004.1 sarcosine dehydrogenase [Sediminivirga luteola]